VTASLPSDVQAVFAQFKTIELTTVDDHGQPITWPATPSYRPAAPCIDITTDLEHPQKVDDARANPLVGLLFSDPMGSGLSDPPMVLVQGNAQVDERASGDRIAIHVRPERVYIWPNGDIATEPALYDAHIDEVRSGHSEEPDRYHADPAGGASTWSPRIADLGIRHPTAVLAIVSPDGFPFAVRAPVHVDAAARWVVVGGAPTGIPFQPGLACLTTGSLQVRGDLVYVDETWALLPHEVIE